MKLYRLRNLFSNEIHLIFMDLCISVTYVDFVMLEASVFYKLKFFFV